MSSRLRTTTVATATGAILLVGVGIAAPAQGVDNYPPGSKAVSCKVSTNGSRSVIKVDMGPNQPGKRSYSFQIERLKKGAWAAYGGVRTTQGSKETRTVNVPKGTYQVQCYGNYGFANSTSKTIKIKK